MSKPEKKNIVLECMRIVRMTFGRHRAWLVVNAYFTRVKVDGFALRFTHLKVIILHFDFRINVRLSVFNMLVELGF